MVRLDKCLADMGLGTRTQVRQLIKKKKIYVNGVLADRPEQKVSETDCIMADGQELSYQKYRYILLHKPAGYVSATEDPKEQTVLELLPPSLRKGLFPVGRLDKDTEGLLLLTNDGALSHRLLSPKKHVNKTYYARISGCVTTEDQQAFLEGVDIGDEKLTLPASLKILISGETSEIELTIQEGRYHQVKRMFEARGMKVLYLKRLSMGNLHLPKDLARGAYQELTLEDIEHKRTE